MLKLTNVSKAYPGGQKVLDSVNLDLATGEFLYVIGGSGAGKTTLLRMIATEEHPSLGGISLFGYDLTRVSPSTLRAIRRGIGFVPQNIRLIPDLTVYDNVELSLKLAGTQSTQTRAMTGELLEKLGLSQKLREPVSTLSGGEAQRVAVARAIVRNPEILIADEPTGAQDRSYTWLLMDLFARANLSKTTVILATHDREIVRRVPKPCAVLKGGHITVGQEPCLF